MNSIDLLLNGKEVYPVDLPHCAIRFAYKNGKVIPALYVNGERTILPWELVADIKEKGGLPETEDALSLCENPPSV
jgi:hypothetical protein